MRPDCAIAQSHVPGQDSKRAWWQGLGTGGALQGQAPVQLAFKAGQGGGTSKEEMEG